MSRTVFGGTVAKGRHQRIFGSDADLRRKASFPHLQYAGGLHLPSSVNPYLSLIAAFSFIIFRLPLPLLLDFIVVL